MGKTPKEIREASSGVAADGNVIHASTSTSDNESIGVLAEDISKLSSLQTAYDKDEEILTADVTPVKIKSPISPASVFQPVLEILDKANATTVKIEAGGLVKQMPFNLELKKTINNGDNGIFLSLPGSLDTHSRLLFLGNAGSPNAGLEIISITNPEEPEHINLITPGGVGVAPFTTSIRTVQKEGNLIYVGALDDGVPIISIIDISNAHDPITLGFIKNDAASGGVKISRTFEVRGKFMYVTTGATAASGDPGLTILDISDPVNIVRVNEVFDGDGGNVILDEPQSLTLHQGLLWIGNTTGGGTSSIECLDVSDPLNIIHLSNIVDGNGSAPFLANVVIIHPTNDVVHIIDRDNDAFQILDYADPTTPVVRGSLKDGDPGVLLGALSDGEVSNDYAYLLHARGGDVRVTTVFVQDPDNPDVLRENDIAPTSVAEQAFVLSGNHAFIADFSNLGKLFVISLSGIESQALRIGDLRVALVDVEDELTARQGDFSESLHVGGDGLLVNGPLAVQKSATIKSVDSDPIKIIAPDSPASVFQSVLEVRDQNNDKPIIIEASGEIEQSPLNLKLVSTTDGDATILANAKVMDVHSRFLFSSNNTGFDIFSIADPEVPRHLNSVGAPLLSNAIYFEHHGENIYAIDSVGTRTFKIIDIGVPTDPKLLGSIADGDNGASIGFSFTIQGNFAFVEDSINSKITILNISDPVNIKVVNVISNGNISTLTNLAGTLTGYTDGEAITLSGGTGSGATATADISGGTIQSVTLVDGGDSFTDGDTLTITGVTSTTSTATIDVDEIINLDGVGMIIIHENFLFAYNTGDDSVECLDISDFTDVKHLSNIVDADGGTPGTDPPFLRNVISMDATRDVVHFCDSVDRAISTIDYSDPTSPVVKDFIKDGVDGVTLGNVRACTVSGRYSYIANDTGGTDLHVASIDVQDADDLKFLQNKLITTFPTGSPIDLQVTGDHMFVLLNASQPNGKIFSIRMSGIETQSMRVGAGRFGDLDVKDKTTCRVLEASESLIVGGRGILSQGKIGGSKSATIKSVDDDPVKIIAPDSPASVFQSVLEIEDQNGDVPILIEGGGEIEQQPFNLKLTSTLIPSATQLVNVTQMEVHSRFLFAINSNGSVEIYSIADPENPKLINTISVFFNSVIGLLHHGDLLYVMDRDGFTDTLRIIDIGNPSDPKELGSIDSGDLGTGFRGGTGMELQGSLIFLPDSDAGTTVDILDISDPDNIRLVNTITDGGAIVLDGPQLCRVHENFLFVYNEGSGGSVSVIDISDPLNPIGLSNITDGTDGAVLDDVNTFHVTRDVAQFCNRSSKTLQVIDYADPSNPVVKDSITDSSFETVSDCVIAGKFAYLLNSSLNPEPRDIMIATIDIQDADNLIFLQNKAFVSSTTRSGALVITGDHLYATTIGGVAIAKRLYSIRNSGLDTQSMRVGAGRFGVLDVKDEMTSRLLDVSESLHVGGRGILSNGKIAGQKGSQIKREIIDVTISGANTTLTLDASDDVTVYNVDASGITADWTVDVENIRAGHRILLKVTSLAAFLIRFLDAKFAIDATNVTDIATAGDLAVLECVLEDESADSIIATVTEV